MRPLGGGSFVQHLVRSPRSLAVLWTVTLAYASPYVESVHVSSMHVKYGREKAYEYMST